MLVLAALAAAAAPLSPAPLPPAPLARPSADAAAAALNDPAVQQIAALEIANLAGIVLDTRIGALAPLAGPDADVRADDTLRSAIRRHDPGAEQRFYDGSRRAVATAGAAASGALAQAAELRRTADRLRVALAPLAQLLNAPQP